MRRNNPEAIKQRIDEITRKGKPPFRLMPLHEPYPYDMGKIIGPWVNGYIASAEYKRAQSLLNMSVLAFADEAEIAPSPSYVPCEASDHDEVEH